MKNFNLELSLKDLLLLEVVLEYEIHRLSEIGLDSEREKSLLKKIYEVSPSDVVDRLKL